jgi:HSP20 family molecular chaperone IbpA
VKLTMECDPKQQVLAQHGDAQKAIAQRTEHDLARFKKFIEKLSKESHDWLGKIKDAEPLTTEAGAAQPAAKAESRQAGTQALQLRTLGIPALEQRAGAVPARMAEMWPMMRAAWFPDLLHMWDEPLNLMRRVSEDMERMMERFAGRAGSEQGAGNASAWTPAVEVAQRDGQFIVCAELAGVKREDVSVEVSGDRLTIEGERRQEPLRGQQEFRSTERAYGHFYRVISLPPGAEASAASASLHDGMLEITMPIVQTGQHGRRIAIRGA